MARHTSHRTKRARDAEGHHAAGNGAAAEAATTTPAEGGATPADERVRRAEEMVDHAAQRIGYFAGWLGHGMLRLAARAREEAEDIWAEAQSLRRGERP
jgi:hypothetical protein